jgi:hypothetical protein
VLSARSRLLRLRERGSLEAPEPIGRSDLVDRILNIGEPDSVRIRAAGIWASPGTTRSPPRAAGSSASSSRPSRLARCSGPGERRSLQMLQSSRRQHR